MSDKNMTIGEAIKQARKNAGMTQKQLAEKCAMADSAIRKYESGRIVPKIKTIEKIASALGEDVISFIPTQRENTDEYDKLAPFLTVEQKKNLAELDEEFLQDLADEAEEELFEQAHRLKRAFYMLNNDGRQKAVERVEELLEIPKYQDTAQIKWVSEQEAQIEKEDRRIEEEFLKEIEKRTKKQAAGDSTQSADDEPAK